MEGVGRKPRLLNRAVHGCPEGAVPIDRMSEWGNPFRVSVLGRLEAVEAYKIWIDTQPELVARIHLLKGKDLVCNCTPRLCHGEYLYERANRFKPTIG